MTFRVLPIQAALALALLAVGCIPKIGDDCNTSLDCSQQGDRLCDSTQPQGYCTVFNCEPNSCPDSSVCVAFNHSIDPACDGKNDGEWPRFERTFCMAGCNQDSDCRTGYACLDPKTEERGGLIIDTKEPREKVCLVALPVSSSNNSVPGICDPGKPGPLPEPYEPPGTGGASSGSSGGGTGGGTGGTGGASSGSGAAGGM